MTILKAPAGTLTDGVVELRLPSPDAGDIATIIRYVEDEQLEGGWLPDVPPMTGERLIKEWLDCWNGRRGRSGATFTFVVTVPEEPRFIGVVGVAEHDDGAFEMTYGTAPGWRGRGLASRATRLAAQWVAEPQMRAAALLAFADAVAERGEELARLDSLDNGSPLHEMRNDIGLATSQIRYLAGLALEVRGRTMPETPGRLNYTVHEPFGVVARIIAFNPPADVRRDQAGRAAGGRQHRDPQAVRVHVAVGAGDGR
jgi:RimJ/RimL family protein N-acetyltransferase